MRRGSWKHYKLRPCPGCGEVERRPPQTLCQRCSRQLELGRKREREIGELRVTGDKVPVAIDTEFAYDIARSTLGFLTISHGDVVAALVRLARLEECERNDVKDARAIWFTYSIARYHVRPLYFVWATATQADDIECVLDYIHKVCQKWYAAGYRDGRDLIMHLATAGTQELNRMTIDG